MVWQIKHVIFDLSEVVLTGIKDSGIALGRKHMVSAPSSHAGLSGTPNPLMIPEAWDFFHAKLTEDQYVAAVLKHYPMFGPATTLKRYIRDNFKEVPGTLDVVKRVRAAGYKLGLLSVHAKEWIDYCDRVYGINSYFDTISYSYVDGVSKPDPRAFLFLLERVSVKSWECMFIDDAERNVVAARKLGMCGVLFISAQELEVELKTRLPNFR